MVFNYTADERTARNLAAELDSLGYEGRYQTLQADQDRVIVMSKVLSSYSGEYAGVTKLDAPSALRLREKVEEMIGGGLCTTWYEDALVQMIFEENFALWAKDISDYQWTEVDNVDDLMYAKSIHRMGWREKFRAILKNGKNIRKFSNFLGKPLLLSFSVGV